MLKARLYVRTAVVAVWVQTDRTKKQYIIGSAPLYNRSGDDSNEDPPVPIPNTEVKLVYADDSWVLTLWK